MFTKSLGFVAAIGMACALSTPRVADDNALAVLGAGNPPCDTPGLQFQPCQQEQGNPAVCPAEAKYNLCKDQGYKDKLCEDVDDLTEECAPNGCATPTGAHKLDAQECDPPY